MPAANNPLPTPPYDNRINRVRAKIRELKLDGYLVNNRMDQYWLTGFTGEDGGVLVTEKHVVLLTDGRFDQTADIEAPYARKVIRKDRGPKTTVREINKLRIAKLGFEPSDLNVRSYTDLRGLLKKTRLAAASGIISDMRVAKDAGEIEAIRRAIRIAEDGFRSLLTWVKPGMREREVAARLVYEMQSAGAQEAAFQPIVAVGANASLPHYEPGDAAVSDNECMLIDWGARRDWYVSDLTRVIWPGKVSSELAKVYNIVREAAEKAIEAIKPGMAASKVDKIARSHIENCGYGPQFNHSLGHGIGLNVHESPGLRRISKEKLRPGMVVTIEPGVYLRGVGGIRIEDDVLVTETGHEVLSSLPTSLEEMMVG